MIRFAFIPRASIRSLTVLVTITGSAWAQVPDAGALSDDDAQCEMVLLLKEPEGVRPTGPAQACMHTVSGVESEAQAESVAVAAKARDIALKGDYARAADLYHRALFAHQNADILFSLAASEQKAGRLPRAITHFREYLEDADANPDRVAQIRTVLMPKALAGTAHIVFGKNAGWPIAAFTSGGTVDGQQHGSSSLYLGKHGETMMDIMPGTHILEGEDDPTIWGPHPDPSVHPRRRWRARVSVAAGGTAVADFEETVVAPATKGH